VFIIFLIQRIKRFFIWCGKERIDTLLNGNDCAALPSPEDFTKLF